MSPFSLGIMFILEDSLAQDLQVILTFSANARSVFYVARWKAKVWRSGWWTGDMYCVQLLCWTPEFVPRILKNIGMNIKNVNECNPGFAESFV